MGLRSCCCCIKLRTGGLIIGWLLFIASIFSIPIGLFYGDEFFSVSAFFNLLFPVFTFLYVYGVYTSKPDLMLPSLITILSLIVSLAIFPLISIICYFDDIAEYVEEWTSDLYGSGPRADGPITGVMLLLLFVYIATGVSSYFWYVLFSLYKSMQEAQYKSLAIAYANTAVVEDLKKHISQHQITEADASTSTGIEILPD